jgi:GH43 family beta-xylosidase
MKRMDINVRDPFILVENNIYYMFGTTMSLERQKFLCWKSRDLKNFEEPVIAFDPPKDFWSDRDFWAPEVHKYKGKYYMFASFKSETKRRGTQILVADKVEGPYRPLTDEPYTPRDWECLDGTLYVEEGMPYSIFAHEWVQIKDGTFCLVQLSNDLTQAVSKPKTILTASEAPWISPLNGDCYVTDGPFIYKMSDSSLILIWSSFSDSGYTIGMAKSTNGINGPFIHIDKPLYKDDGGHAMIFRDLNGNLMLTFHKPNTLAQERPFFLQIEEHNGILRVVH